jgi:hypothetical protein
MLRTLIIAGCAVVVALAVGSPRPALASPPPAVYGERGGGLVESNLYRKRHPYPPSAVRILSSAICISVRILGPKASRSDSRVSAPGGGRQDRTALPLLIGVGITTYWWESGASIRYEKAQCANAHALGIRPTTGENWVLTGPDDHDNIDLKQIGCSCGDNETITYREARAPLLRTVVEGTCHYPRGFISHL